MSDAPNPLPRSTFPTWVIVGGLLLAAAYLPTLAAPFDFVDDGNLVYPTRGLTLAGHVELWWKRVTANVEHLGPFRPVVWAHWQVQANLFADDAGLWRAARLGWCAVAAVMLLWLMRELNLHPAAALVTAAAAMWNPYRNEVWTSLTLAEGVAMPYALLALVAARKAGRSPRSWRWDAAAVFGLLMALGCKNTFVALLPPILLLRTWADGQPFRAGLRTHWKRAAVYLLPVLLPVAHFVYFKTHWHPGYYETPGPSWEQARQFALWLKGAAGADFLAVGVALVLGVLVWERKSPGTAVPGLAITLGLLVLASGFLVYLPVNIMSGRYTMPAVWGADVLLAAALTRFAGLPDSWPKRVAGAGVAVGLVAVIVAGVNRQEKTAARSRLLWELVEHVEQTAPKGATIAWVSGPTDGTDLNAEEGIHFAWHLLHRGRIDVRVGLFDLAGEPVPRVELAPLTTPPQYRVAAAPSADAITWKPDREVTVRYRFGARTYSCVMEKRRDQGPPTPTDPVTERMLRDALTGFDPVKKLLEKPRNDTGVAERK